MAQDGAGGLELTGNAFPIDPVPQNIAYLKKVLASGFLRFSLESVMAINQQSFLVSNMCDEFMVCGGMRVWSDNMLIGAVCGEESSVMFIERVPPTAMWDCFCCEAIEREEKLTVPASRIDIYLQQEASPFCVAKPLQVRMELATEVVLCFPSPWWCQNPSLCRTAIGRGRMKRLRWNAVLRSALLNVKSSEQVPQIALKMYLSAAEGQIATAIFCRRGWIL